MYDFNDDLMGYSFKYMNMELYSDPFYINSDWSYFHEDAYYGKLIYEDYLTFLRYNNLNPDNNTFENYLIKSHNSKFNYKHESNVYRCYLDSVYNEDISFHPHEVFRGNFLFFKIDYEDKSNTKLDYENNVRGSSEFNFLWLLIPGILLFVFLEIHVPIFLVIICSLIIGLVVLINLFKKN